MYYNTKELICQYLFRKKFCNSREIFPRIRVYHLPGRDVRDNRAHHTKKREEWGIVSHIIRYCFNPCGTGSHLYTANANTLRSVHRNKDLLALVGTHLSWSPCPPLLYPYCITIWAICQEVFCIFLNSFCGVPIGSLPTLFPLDTLIISQVFQLVKGFLWHHFDVLSSTLTQDFRPLVARRCPPLT